MTVGEAAFFVSYFENVLFIFRDSLFDVLFFEAVEGAVGFFFFHEEVDVVQPVLVAFGHEDAEAALGEGFIDEGRCQARIVADVAAGFHRFRDHDVGFAFGDEAGDFGVLRMDEEGAIGEVREGEFFIRAARVAHDADVFAIEVGFGFEFPGVFFAAEDGLAECEVAAGHIHFLFACKGAGDAADGDIEFAGHGVFLEGFPCGGDVFDGDAQGFCQKFGDFAVKAFVFPCFLIEVAHRLVIAGAADEEGPACLDVFDFSGINGGGKARGAEHGACQQCADAQFLQTNHYIHLLSEISPLREYWGYYIISVHFLPLLFFNKAIKFFG